ncbi:MAG: Transport protein [Promethearchaeota archaeon]|nr:MAG: Transport protein [Candidatus Lokiarchaeota archaeon]
MFISGIIILACFIGVIILIVTEKLNRAVSSLLGAVITYFVLIFFEGLDFSVIVDLLFGNSEDGYVNLHSLILIIGMMIIVDISNEAGLFQFIAIKLIIFSKGEPLKLMVIFCGITIFISAILNNILTVIILIPLTITVSRILNVDPSPYILTQAVLVNIGGTFFSISSIPNILITTSAQISFIEFFLNVGLISLIIFLFTVLFFFGLYRKDLKIPQEGKDVLEELNAWNLVQSRRLLFKSLIALTSVMVLFILVPSDIISPDIIALSIALILIISVKLDPKQIISRIDFELILYLLGIFIIAGGLEIIGIINLIGDGISGLGGNDSFLQLTIILWFSAFLSSSIDNIPITKVLIPVVGTLSENIILPNEKQLYYSLAIGANWGDNLTPLGDNILVLNIAEKNKRPLKFNRFFRLGFITTIYQLFLVTILYSYMFHFLLGSLLTVIILIFLFTIYFFQKFNILGTKAFIDQFIKRIRKTIIG